VSDSIDLTNPDTRAGVNGGRLLSLGAGPPVRDFGWLPTPLAERQRLLKPFRDEPDLPQIQGDKVFLWEFVKSINGGQFCPFNWQLTGSCVNGGFYNAFRVLQAVDIACRPDPVAFQEPFTLAVYGQARHYEGSDDEGEGTFGLDMARAAAEFGLIPGDDPAVPRPVVCGPAVAFDRATELKWSSVRNQPAGLKDRSARYNLQFTQVHTADQVTAELRKGRPLTWAGIWGGQMSGAVKMGTDTPVLVMPRSEKWNHQQSVLGYWKHPELGELWYIQNQWYIPGPGMRVEYIQLEDGAYAINRITTPGPAIPMLGESLQGEPPGGYWIRRKDMDYQLAQPQGEVCSFSGLHGYDGRPIGFGPI
jgi:hypothetical protein